MKLTWMFGSSMAAHHLLYVYLSVWLIQGGYCVWIALQWMRTKKGARTGTASSAPTNQDL
jgi:threonine/homoserine/homoserine lactone efflux protein